MPQFDIKWEVKVTGGLSLNAATLEEALETVKSAVGSGISVAANLHHPEHGLGITFSLAEIPKKSDLVIPQQGPININGRKK